MVEVNPYKGLLRVSPEPGGAASRELWGSDKKVFFLPELFGTASKSLVCIVRQKGGFCLLFPFLPLQHQNYDKEQRSFEELLSSH